ncbi:MAG: glycosyltransferase [Nitriliruptorales bacterium]|nr:glycosyltransferase [Nitriliruptorales bacterium]
MLPGQRPWRELHWLASMPETQVRAVGTPAPPDADDFVHRPYLQPTKRFVEAGSLAWLRGLRTLEPTGLWIASLELCSLISGQAARFARRHQRRHAVLVWANDPATPLYWLPPYSLATRASLDADLFLCFVHAAADHLEELGVDLDRVRVVHPGVDLAVFRPPAKPPEEPTVVFASPLAENKGIDRVLAAFRGVRSAVPDARLVIAGGGPLEPLVRRAAQDDGGVSYVGRLARDEVADLLRSATVFTTAPRANLLWNEQFGLAYVEAMACGVPVVTTRCGSNHEAVAGPNVLVPQDTDALTEAIVGFLEDRDRRSHVSAWNVAHVQEEHDLVKQTRRMGQVFSEFEGGADAR